MAKPSKSKNSSDDAEYDGLNPSDEDEEEIAGEKSPSPANDAGNKAVKMAKNITGKRRQLVVSCTSSEHSLSVEVVLSNRDLLTEILFRVPAKSLLMCKSVSKHWLSLISAPQFATNHARRNSCSLISGLYVYHKPWINKVLKSVSVQGDPTLPTLAFIDPIREGSTSHNVSSCNGLLLFLSGRRTRYIVCNPTTQNYIVLPEIGGNLLRSLSDHLGFGAYLAFDPSKSPYYKVVLVSYQCNSSGKTYLIYIYSSESASWKHITLKAPDGGSFTRRVFWNGAIHWMSHTNVHIRFDVDTENLTGTLMPKIPNILCEDKTRYFGECGGSLLLIQTRKCWASGFRILEMERDCSRWIVKYRVNLRHIRSEGFYPDYRVLSVVNGANERDFALVLAIPGKLILYNLNCKSVKVLLDTQGEASQPDSYYYAHAHKFIESLYPL